MPASNVTILFTDLVGSTQLLDRLGDRAGEALMRSHFEMLRRSIAQHDGHVVKMLGDGIMAIFRHPSDGIACAGAMQQGVARHNASQPNLLLAMRAGVHCGPAIRAAGDYYGIGVIIAKRLCDHCTGGQVIVSDAVRRLAAGLDGGYEELDLLTLKGMSTQVRAAAFRWDEIAA